MIFDVTEIWTGHTISVRSDASTFGWFADVLNDDGVVLATTGPWPSDRDAFRSACQIAQTKVEP